MNFAHRCEMVQLTEIIFVALATPEGAGKCSDFRGKV